MKMFIILLIFVLFHDTGAVIYRLNDTQYALMPPVFHMDPYEECQLDADALYCTAEFVLVSDQPSPLLDMIKEYSEHYVTHYNHTKLHYGICVTKTCKTFYEKEKEDLRLTLGACLNESFTKTYDLKVKVQDGYYCHPPGKAARNIDYLDIIVGVICIIFIMFNIIGSFCKNFLEKYNKNRVSRILLCFSLQRNWNKLVTPAAESQDPRLKRLRGFNGLKTIMISCMIFGHTFITAIFMIDNPNFIENLLARRSTQIFSNGPLIMQVFLMMSAFLLVYLSLLHSEKHEVSWSLLPKHVIIRWLRLTPSYALILALISTWFAHLAIGPFWHESMEKEMTDCRQYWWQNVLYINNFFSNSNCMPQAWYLAVDTQLYLLAVIVYLACRTPRSRIITLSLLFVAGMIIPAAIIYSQDLEGVLLGSPKFSLKLFHGDPHFHNVYIRFYCNLPGNVVGMAIAYLLYHWQQKGVDFKKFQTRKYRIIFGCLLPLAVLCFFSSSIFYDDAPRQSIYFRTAYAAIVKPTFSVIGGLFLLGLIIKIRGVYRSVLEWRGWSTPSKLTYSAYLLHSALIRIYVVAQTSTTKAGFLSQGAICLTILVGSFLAAFLFWMLVEAPLSNIVKEYLPKPAQEHKVDIEKASASN